MSTEGVPATREIQLPAGVEARLEGGVLTLTGPLGSVSRDFRKIPVAIMVQAGRITLTVPGRRKREVSVLGTAASHIKNMIKGVTQGFTYRLKIVYSHFPMTVRVKGDMLYIENFYGERSARRARIVGGCKVSVEGEDVVVRGLDKEAVGQTAANIELATKVRRKDPRVFLDGIYLYKREEGM
jgi:large subunit ribosomal protein L6